MRKNLTKIFYLILLLTSFRLFSQNPVREKINIDKGWKFAFGHQYDTEKDFNHDTSYFSYLAKTGYADGPASPKFDDRAWRKLDIPHDWAVEQPFSKNASPSHGFKAAGKGFSEKNTGWYRKILEIPQSDLGKVITLKFDGVFRNSKVFFNGHYLGTEESGYNGFEYDITSYINYGSENVVAVRVDASMEEGWYYEGAGIYRHVYLEKTNQLRVKTDGTFVYTEKVDAQKANLKIALNIENKGHYKGKIEIVQEILDNTGEKVASFSELSEAPEFYQNKEIFQKISINQPKLWDIDTPNLYKLITKIVYENKISDTYTTTFGVRTIHFDAEKGFFLNGKNIKLKGTNNHQDYAGVGVAAPDELHYFRIKKLKEMGSNAYRTSHHPPASELLNACDELGMLVIDESRLMGINDIHLNNLKYLIERDRNHPSVICWSVGNEEWMIEGNITGERIASTLQDYAKKIDATRPVTIGISSGFKSGISSVVEIMGYNYLGNGDIDAHRKEFPNQPGMGTEEGSTFATRGVYFTDDSQNYKSAYDQKPRPTFYSIQEGWKFYAERPYLAGMFIWTGFDYRGEPTPYGWPSVNSYFGMMDTCGFPKDNVYYLKSWWGKEPVLHLFPHWNWQGMEGKEIDVWVYSNADEVELFLNKKSLGKKKMETNGHLSWQVPYQKGNIEAVGYKNGKKILYSAEKTTDTPQNISMKSHKNHLVTDTDIAVVTVEVLDKNGLHVPTANNEIEFSVKGGGKIIGVGNGNPTSLEKDKFIDEIRQVGISGLKEQKLSSGLNTNISDINENLWTDAFKTKENETSDFVYKGTFVLDENPSSQKITFFYEKLGNDSVIFINGKKILPSSDDSQKYILDSSELKSGENSIHILATPQKKKNAWDELNKNPGYFQVVTPSGSWKRKLFNGYAQVIVQSDGSREDISLTASGKDLKSNTIIIKKAENK
ncbi:MAG: beta-galactosidase GalA [Bergeyella sp.]